VTAACHWSSSQATLASTRLGFTPFDQSAKLDAKLPVVFVANSFVFTLRHAMVAAPMRTRYDQFGKQMVRTALETRGPVETDAEVPADTRRIDLWFMPDPARGSVPDHLGVLGRIAGGQQAIAELKELQAEAPERALALPILLRLRLTVPSDPEKQTTDDQEFLMDTQDIVETWRREAIQEGVEQGVKQGVAHSLVEVYEARFGAMPYDLRAVVEDTDDEPTLVAWLRIAGTRSVDELAAAIRSFRAS
jgi:hypothetical protein